jgi:hypothetical protein
MIAMTVQRATILMSLHIGELLRFAFFLIVPPPPPLIFEGFYYDYPAHLFCLIFLCHFILILPMHTVLYDIM